MTIIYPTTILGVGNFDLINSKNLQIGIGIGKFSVINSEELRIGNFLEGRIPDGGQESVSAKKKLPWRR